jgi:hypothetical protein
MRRPPLAEPDAVPARRHSRRGRRVASRVSDPCGDAHTRRSLTHRDRSLTRASCIDCP